MQTSKTSDKNSNIPVVEIKGVKLTPQSDLAPVLATDEGPQADPVSAGSVAYRAELSACNTPTYYAQVGRSLARTAARKVARAAILAALSGAKS